MPPPPTAIAGALRGISHGPAWACERLGRAECLQLLATATLGRISITSGALPIILPVNFRVGGDQIVVRTGEGSKLEAATRNTVVAFEVDSLAGRHAPTVG